MSQRAEPTGSSKSIVRESVVEFIVSDEASSVRIDLFLSQHLPHLSRSHIQELIRQGQVEGNGKAIKKPSQKIPPGAKVVVRLRERHQEELMPEKVPLTVLYEDDDLLAINKPAGLLTHPAGRKRTGTIVNALLGMGVPLSCYAGSFRPGIIHRLDKETSGVLLIAKNDFTHREVLRQLKERKVEKTYWAIVVGEPDFETKTVALSLRRDPRNPTRIIPSRDLTGKAVAAITHFQVIRKWSGFSLIEAKPVTGRTHQIRVHLKALGLAVVGDRDYGGRAKALKLAERMGHRALTKALRNQKGHALHALRIRFHHPRHLSSLTIEAPLPTDFQNLLSLLEGLTTNDKDQVRDGASVTQSGKRSSR
ncbi:MAG: RluA family pseudouridine synthase [Armatimonadota bacterium]|nr:RluA family pseudouridine synthase [Armatimonadota bacterium]